VIVMDGREESSDVGGELASAPLPPDTVGLLEGITSTRAIRRYRDEPVPPEALRAILFAASRGPSGSNRQPFRFVVLADGPTAREAKRVLGDGARRMWRVKRDKEGYDRGSGSVPDSPKARMALTMQEFVDGFERVPVVILPCVIPTLPVSSGDGAEGPATRGAGTEAASIFPACQNLLLAARALGYGGVFTGFNYVVDEPLRALLGVPDDVFIAGTITLGRPVGGHGPVRRRPLSQLVFEGRWGDAPAWAVDPPGTTFVSANVPGPALSEEQLARIEDSVREAT
jgi:nitroreductase